MEWITHLLARAKYLVNSFGAAVRAPPEILIMICSYLGTEEGVFSASQVCHHWREAIIPSPPLWSRFSCRSVSRTVVGLERCKSTPVQLGFSRQLSNVALEKVLLHGNKVTSLDLRLRFDRFSGLGQLFQFSRPSVERLYIYHEELYGADEFWETRELWGRLPSLHELFVRHYSILIGWFTAPNLTHLALDEAGPGLNVTVKPILDLLRGCPLLESLFIAQFHIPQGSTRKYSCVSLPHLRSIELGASEAGSGLITRLLFPPSVAVGFRMGDASQVWSRNPLTNMDTMEHVLGRVDIRSITLAAGSPGGPSREAGLLVRFEWLCGSLEITFPLETGVIIRNFFFGPSGMLFSGHVPQIENVRELHVVGCPFEDGLELHHVHAAMPNLVSISFFHYGGPRVFGLLTPTDLLSTPFPHLERIMVLGPESGLREVVKTRKDRGVPLKTLILGRGSGWFEYDHEDREALREFVGDLRIECPTEILGWGTENEVLKVWSTGDTPGPVSPNRKLMIPG